MIASTRTSELVETRALWLYRLLWALVLEVTYCRRRIRRLEAFNRALSVRNDEQRRDIERLRGPAQS